MDLMQALQSVLQNSAGSQFFSKTGSGVLDSLAGKMKNSSDILGPAVLGGLLGVLTSSKTARRGVGGALLVGGGAMLWNKYKESMARKDTGATSKCSPERAAPANSTYNGRAERLVWAVVFAAKCDGHIDAAEEENIRRELSKLDLGPDAETLVKKALDEPLDPEALARMVTSPEEALELYTLSYAVITADSFMERSYLDALARALHIPDDVKEDLEKNLDTSI